MAAGVTDRLWDINDVIKLLEEYRAELVEKRRLRTAVGSSNPTASTGARLQGRELSLGPRRRAKRTRVSLCLPFVVSFDTIWMW